MEYVASSTEDRKLHDKYHKQNTEGYDVGKDVVQKARNYSTFKGARSGDTICAVDCYDTPARKRRGQAVLEVVQRELGAVEIPEQEIWDYRKAAPNIDFDLKFRSYLYVRGAKCIGFLLMEKISEAYLVVEPTLTESEQRILEEVEKEVSSGALSALKSRQKVETERTQILATHPITLSQESVPARLGVSRIWTSPTHRHQNIATSLLDTMFQHHNDLAASNEITSIQRRERSEAQGVSQELQKQIYDLLPNLERLESKDVIAFSQPTEAGVRLARKWFGKMFGWAVYVD